ncbi:MAG: hypothetical protein CVU05_11670 [Bacteroidetes bacterium HGW-Bacteroidetes-21]|jgi:hypothetical protein|nr:MAG: hypothetical protein CVU05_11670 [Bacteroidetes bacterium HGW-Bacteroidetes-21]
MRKIKLLMLLVALAIGSVIQAQTVLISPTGDGGFETGAGLAANGWTAVNNATNQWFAGTATFSAGANSAYISNTAGSTYAYDNATTAVSHFYRDIIVPAGESLITLTFKIKGDGDIYGSSYYDKLMVYTAPTTFTPTTAAPASPGTTLTGATLVYAQAANYGTAYTTITVTLPASLAGTTFRLIFTWHDDSSAGAVPSSVDEISLVSKAPVPMHGIYTIDNTLATTYPLLHNGTDNFASFTDAVNYLNTEGISAPVTFNVLTGLTFTEMVPAITTSGTSANTITFQRFGSLANPKIMAGVGVGSVDAGITINGADYINFDGIDIQENAANTTTTTQLEYGYYIRNFSATNGAQSINISNARIILNRTNTATRAIYSNVAVTPTSATGANSNNSYYSNTIENSYSGIYLTGNSTYPDLNTMITNNMVGAATANDIGNGGSASNGIRVTSQSGATIANNVVRNVSTTGNTAYGIYLESAQGTNNIFNNKIYSIGTSSTGTTNLVYGIRTDINSTHTANVFNNMISDLNHGITTASATQVIRAIAVGVSGAGTGNFAFNSVLISEDANASSTAFYVNGGTVNLLDNVFANMSAGGATSKRYCIYRGGGTLTSNYNDLYVDAAGTNNFIGYYTADQATLAAWQTASTSQDMMSMSVDPTFVGLTDLHTTNSMLNGTGIPVAGITHDIDGQLRDVTSPDLGADENLAPPAYTCTTPAPGNTLSTVSSICFGETVGLSMQNATAGTGVTYQWQSSTDGTTYTDITSATNTVYSTIPQEATYYRCAVTCANGPETVNSTPVQITFTNEVLTTTSGTRCGTGTVALEATGSTGTTLNWYDAATAGAIVGTGSPINTPVISATTTYYVAAEIAVPSTIVSGTGASTSSTYSNPFYSLWSNIHAQHLILASELSAAGLVAGDINSVALDVTNAGTLPMIDLSVKIGTTTATDMTTFVPSGTFQEVYTNASLMPTTGINVLTFTTPFTWDGTSNIVLEFCHGNGSSTATMNRTVKADATTYVSSIKTHVSAATSAADICGNVASNLATYSVRPTFTFAGQGACSSPRIPVVATVTTAAEISLTASQTVCNDAVATVSVTSTLSDYDSYTWAPAANLFTDVTCTVPYVAGANATTVYLKTATAGDYVLTCNANNTSTLCSDVETTTVTVIPGTIAVTADPAIICVSGTSDVSASPSTGFGAATFQWQVSFDGTVFNDIPGATALNFTTPTITQNTWGQLVVSVNSVACFTSDAEMITVNNPQVTSTTAGTRCGTGTVALEAIGSTGATLNWYDAATAGTLVGTGSTFTTPVISATTDYFVEAAIADAPVSTGKIAPASTETGSTFVSWGIVFDVLEPVTLTSVDLYATTGGTVDIKIMDAALTTELYSTGNITLIAGGTTTPNVIPLNYNIASGTGYRMLIKSYAGAVIVRGSSGVSFPYISDAVNVTSSEWGGTTTSTYYYFYNLTYINSCASSRTAVTATVTAPTAITVTATPDEICAGVSSDLLVSSTNTDYTYVWSTGDVTATFADSPLTTTTYTVTASDVSGCVNVGTVDVTVNALPANVTATASQTAVTCGGSIDLASTPPSGTIVLLDENFNGVTNNWVATNNSTGGTPADADWTLQADGYTYSSVVYHSNDNSQFYMTNSDDQGSGGTTSTLLESPSFSTIGLNVLQLTFNQYYRHIAGDFARVEVWNGSTWATLVEYTATDGAAAAFVEHVVDMSAYAGLADVKIRFNYSGSYSWYWAIDNVLVNSVNPTVNYAWTSTPVGFTANTQNVSSVSPLVSTDYTVVVTNAANCSASANVSVTVDALPAPTLTVTDNCGSSDIVMTNYSGTITWNTSETTPTITVTTGGDYNAIYTDNGCVSENATANANPIAIPAAPVAVNETVCTGTTVPDLTVTGTGTMNWYDDVALTNMVNTGMTFATGETAAATYTYYVNATENGCTSTTASTITLTINESPVATLTPTVPSVCGAADGSIAATTGYSYLWSTTPAQTTETATGLAAGSYYVTISNTNCSIVLSETLADPGAPSVTLVVDEAAVCPGTTVTFTASGADAYEFFVNGVSQGAASANNTYTSNTIVDGDYVTVAGVTSGCTGISSQIDISVYTVVPVVISEVSGSLVSDAVAGNQWFEQTIGLLTDSVNQAITPTADGDFYVVVTDANGCTATSNVINFIYVSVSQTGFNAGLSVYPNPSNGIVNVNSTSPVSYIVTTVDGRVILRNDVMSTEATMDLSSQAKGVYFVKFFNDNGNAVYRIVIE